LASGLASLPAAETEKEFCLRKKSSLQTEILTFQKTNGFLFLFTLVLQNDFFLFSSFPSTAEMTVLSILTC
jgi:hypothetical protein